MALLCKSTRVRESKVNERKERRLVLKCRSAHAAAGARGWMPVRPPTARIGLDTDSGVRRSKCESSADPNPCIDTKPIVQMKSNARYLSLEIVYGSAA